MAIPTRDEINVYDSLDERVAVEQFLGKDLAAAEKMFFDYPCRYEESLTHMGPVAFRYYVQAAINCLKNGAATEHYSVVSGVLVALESRLEFEADELRPIVDDLIDFCGYVLAHDERFDRTPKTSEEWETLLGYMRQAFEKFGIDKLQLFDGMDLRDWIDLRPRFTRLREEFMRWKNEPKPTSTP